jgi:biofilm PGA synthesis protein PgaD
MRARDAVITGYARTSPLRRGFFALVTAAAWTAFGWLVFPAVTALLWLVGLSVAYDETFAALRKTDRGLLLKLLAVATLAAGVLVVWAEVQRRRFAGPERRQRAPDADIIEVSAALGASAETAARLQGGKIVVLQMNGDGTPGSALELPMAAALPRSTPSLIPTQWESTSVDEIQPRPRA